MTSTVATLGEQLGNTANVLLGHSAMHGEGNNICHDLLSQDDPADQSVLWVSFRQSAGDCLASWRDRYDVDPATCGAIVVGDTGDDIGDMNPNAVQHVGNASDLTGLGIKVGEFVSNQEGQITVCINSLTALLQYVDLETAYEFLHVLTGQLYNAGAFSHFHLDPSAHDEKTIETLMMLFDAYVDLREAEPAIRARSVSKA